MQICKVEAFLWTTFIDPMVGTLVCDSYSSNVKLGLQGKQMQPDLLLSSADLSTE